MMFPTFQAIPGTFGFAPIFSGTNLKNLNFSFILSEIRKIIKPPKVEKTINLQGGNSSILVNFHRGNGIQFRPPSLGNSWGCAHLLRSRYNRSRGEILLQKRVWKWEGWEYEWNKNGEFFVFTVCIYTVTICMVFNDIWYIVSMSLV